jgi:hypothetical protein
MREPSGETSFDFSNFGSLKSTETGHYDAPTFGTVLDISAISAR